MLATERYVRPYGRFPSVEAEAAMRTDFLFVENNPLFQNIVAELKANQVDDPKHFIACNILAFQYGIHFYNTICQGAVYRPDELPPTMMIVNTELPTIFVVPETDVVYINLGARFSNEMFNINPLEVVTFNDEPEVDLLCYLTQILDGLEEASHLHLQMLQRRHGSNSNSETDHPNTMELWKRSDSDTVAYRSKLWHEFAAVTVQRAYLAKYLRTEFPLGYSNFEAFYEVVRKARHRWTRSNRTK